MSVDRDNLIKRVLKYYVSPYSKLYGDIQILMDIITRGQVLVQTADPQSWHLMNHPYKTLDRAAALDRLSLIDQYLMGHSNLFNIHRILRINESIPYFEWVINRKIYSLTDELGKKQLIIDASDIPLDRLEVIVENLKGRGDIRVILLNHMDLKEEMIEYNIHYIRQLDYEFVQNSTRLGSAKRGIRGLFSTTVDAFLIDQVGKLKEILNRNNLHIN